MSTLGIDTSQLISKFTTSESQSEWKDVEDALLKAFPGKSMAEIHAQATLYAAQNPNATIDEMVSSLSKSFAVSISTELAAEIRNEWDEFNSASDLSPIELLAVLDDYSGDKVDTSSRAYLMFIMQALQKEIERITAETMEAGEKASKTMYDAAKAELNEKIEEMNKPPGFFDKVMPWLSAAAAVIGAAIAIAVAVAVSVGTGGVAAGLAITAAVIACVLAVSAVAGAATGGEYSLAGVTAKLLEACGVDKETAQWIGLGVEITLAIVGICCSLGAGFAASAGSGASTATNAGTTAAKTADTAAKAADTAAKAADTAAKVADATAKMKSLTQVLSFIQGALMVGTGIAQGAKAIADYNYAMDQAELTELKAILERLLAILKANQAVDQQMLEAIFGAIRKTLTDTQSEYLDTLLKSSNIDMA